jgi:hypothetical protein
MTKIIPFTLLLFTLAGCASVRAENDRKLRTYAWGDDLLACEAQMRQRPNAAVDSGAAIGMFLVSGVLIDGGAVQYRALFFLCMGDAGWLSQHADHGRFALDWRRTTSAEQEAWPTVKAKILAAIQAYERARADSIRKP